MTLLAWREGRGGDVFYVYGRGRGVGGEAEDVMSD